MRRRHVRSCDEHPKYQGGCDGCNAQNRRYMIRRTLNGKKLSAESALVLTWLRELRAAGYSTPHLAKVTGINDGYLRALSNGEPDWVQLKTFHAIQRAYAELRDFPGPDRRTAGYARRRGWTPPEPPPAPEPISEDHVDLVAVNRAVKGDRTVCLTRAEQLAAWEVLEQRGLSAEKIGRTLGVTERTIQRLRSGATVKPYARRTG